MAKKLSQADKLERTFTDSLDDVQVRLLPQLVALAEVATEGVLVLHHVAGDAQADGRDSGWS